RRRRRPCRRLGGGRHGGRGGPGTAARRDGRGRTRREGAGPCPSRRRAETRRLFRLPGSIPTWLARQLAPPAAGAATAWRRRRPAGGAGHRLGGRWAEGGG